MSDYGNAVCDKCDCLFVKAREGNDGVCSRCRHIDTMIAEADRLIDLANYKYPVGTQPHVYRPTWSEVTTDNLKKLARLLITGKIER